jgi:hypothetical protein
LLRELPLLLMLEGVQQLMAAQALAAVSGGGQCLQLSCLE